jgi:hypothetical protein
MQVRKAPDFRSFYVNWLQGSFSPYDISLAIGQGRTTGPTSFEVEHQANILFSPLEAKVAVAMLGNLIRIFESNFGEVKIPKTMEAQFAAPFPSITAEKKTEGN